MPCHRPFEAFAIFCRAPRELAGASPRLLCTGSLNTSAKLRFPLTANGASAPAHRRRQGSIVADGGQRGRQPHWSNRKAKVWREGLETCDAIRALVVSAWWPRRHQWAVQGRRSCWRASGIGCTPAALCVCKRATLIPTSPIGWPIRAACIGSWQDAAGACRGLAHPFGHPMPLRPHRSLCV